MRKKTTVFALLMLGFMAATVAQSPKKKSVPVDSSKMERMVLITTDYGNMKVKLYNATPKHRDNFVKLVKQGFYDSLLFHRVIQTFMIQGGDPQSKNAAPGVQLGSGDIGYTVPAEFVDTIYHKKGSLCAARTENPAKASSSCQFYIVQGKTFTNEQLDQMAKKSYTYWKAGIVLIAACVLLSVFSCKKDGETKAVINTIPAFQ